MKLIFQRDQKSLNDISGGDDYAHPSLTKKSRATGTDSSPPQTMIATSTSMLMRKHTFVATVAESTQRRHTESRKGPRVAH